MRVLHVIAGMAPRYGGPLLSCLGLCYELARRGEQMAIYTTNIDGDSDLDTPLEQAVWDQGVEIRYFPVQTPRSYTLSLPLARALKTAIPQYDLVHIYSLYLFPPTVAAYYCRRYNVPYLVEPHGTLDPYLFQRHRGRKWLYERVFEWRNLNQAAAIRFTTAEEQELTRPLNLRAPGVVIPIGIDSPPDEGTIPVGTFHTAWPETQDKKLLLFLSRLHFKKGLDILTKAFGLIARQRDDVHLVLAGPDDQGYGVQVRDWLAAEGVLAKCTFTGMLLGKEKWAAFRDAAVFVLPSYTENFGIAVVEAMAAGVPVVISDKVNIWREVTDAGAGVAVGCDAQELCDALLPLLANPETGKVMGLRGRQLVEQQFSWDVIGDRMLQVYRQILEQRTPMRTGHRPDEQG